MSVDIKRVSSSLTKQDQIEEINSMVLLLKLRGNFK